ncbi:MAG: excalibur calcium-binding domain-containing protein [Aurantimonas endophytica]|uniref:excalibur calcium-binding domain-containing protein n=1 Tax=Aurantimonas endophytica TaxID=1522175 RepID=UPI003002BEA7
MSVSSPGKRPDRPTRPVQQQRRWSAARQPRRRARPLRGLVKHITNPVVILVVGLVGYGSFELFRSPWPVTTTLQHTVGARNCDAMRAYGPAPARRGQPGYHPHLDRDGDGVACEAWR